MNNLAFEILIIVILCLFNGYLAMAELSLMSSNKARLRDRASKGSKAAARALRLAENPSRALAATQIGITLVGIIAGVFGGATLAEDFALWLEELNFSSSWATAIAFTVVIGVITFISLILGELVPKQIALTHPERIAKLVSGPAVFLMIFFRPAVWLLDKSSQCVMRLFPFSRARPEITQEDIHLAIAEGAKRGQIHPEEKDMAFRLFRLDDRPISAFMTARRDVRWLDLLRPFDDVYKEAIEASHSFFPVAEGDLDHFVGVVSIKDLVAVKSSPGTLRLQDRVRPALKVPSGKDALGVLEDFKRERRQVAIVVDEHGGVDGVVTTHDLLEAIVGDLADYEGEAQSMVKRSDGSLLVDAGVDIHELLLSLGLDPSLAGTDEEYHSVGGLVFGELGRLPKVGAVVEWKNLRLEIVDMDGNRIDKVLVGVVPAETEASLAL